MDEKKPVFCDSCGHEIPESEQVAYNCDRCEQELILCSGKCIENHDSNCDGEE